MRMVSAGLLVASACAASGCSVTVPPPVDVRGSAPLYIEPGAAPPGTAATVTVLPPAK